MDEQTINKIKSQVCIQFPALKESIPEITSQPNGNYLLIFRSQGITANGHSLPMVLRIIADAQGNILKQSQSR